ncbi:NADH-dependent methylglyoxal reductase [Catenisphaera adipataccumulans]|uniref:Methylglyoxal reductase n=1 Tax=Catenisphaera adipataccumulans TaxID=700500 RepID=A0A7W8FVJ0_9FIRM|nr:aldo/keto reductase [Catenisphaera adipataccumulans]MBB5182246.1 methylglyoxal reductase [Catenisphaera adipataccumulans]
MRYEELGSSGIQVSKMGLGTWAIGGGPAWSGDLDEQRCIDTIVEAVNQGINLIDTAPGYNFGNSERIVGKALKKVDRDKVVLVTKCGVVWTRKGTPWNKVGDRQLYKLLTPESIRLEVEESLERLQTDHIDLYMTHWPSVPPFETPIKDTVETLNELKKEGKIRAIGAANVSIDQIKEYLKYCELDLVQGKYSVLDRAVEKELIPLCVENKITMQAYSPLEQGLLTGTISKDYRPEPGNARANKKWWQPGNMERVIDMLDAWKPLAEKYNASIPALCLAWIMNQGSSINLLTGATTPDEVKMNAVAADIVLSEEDNKKMRAMAEALDR